MKEFINEVWQFTGEQVADAFSHLKRKKPDFWPTPANVVAECEGPGDAGENAEARAAYEFVTTVLPKFAHNDVEGCWSIKDRILAPKRYREIDGDHEIMHSRKERAPRMDERTEFALRMSGGISRLMEVLEEPKSMPFYQKEFFGHFNGYEQAKVPRMRLGIGGDLGEQIKQLTDKVGM